MAHIVLKNLQCAGHISIKKTEQDCLNDRVVVSVSNVSVSRRPRGVFSKVSVTSRTGGTNVVTSRSRSRLGLGIMRLVYNLA